MVAYLLKHRSYGVVIRYSFLAFILYFVGHLACFDHVFYVVGNENGALRYFFDKLAVFRSEFVYFVSREELAHLEHIVDELALIFCCHRYDVVHRQITEHTCFNLYLLGVCLPLHFIACLKLFLCHHTCRLKHLDTVVFEVVVEDYRAACFAVESSFCSFSFPFFAVAVAVKADWLAFFDVFADHFDYGCSLFLATCDESVNLFLELNELFGHSCVKRNHGTGAVGFRTYGTELETVSCEGEWRCAVAVCVVDEKLWNLRNVKFHSMLAAEGLKVIVCAILKMVENFREL